MKKLALGFVVALTFSRPAVALQPDELLSLVAMPLAVTAVSELAGVPPEPLFDLVSLLNAADVPPTQFIEVVRYVPVALLEEDPGIVRFTRLRSQEGLRGEALVRAIGSELQRYDVPRFELNVVAPRYDYFVADGFVPVLVRNRVAERRDHPHGGPPGQLKKIAGVKTGAEIVHGRRPGNRDKSDFRGRRDDDRSENHPKREKWVKKVKDVRVESRPERQGRAPKAGKVHGGGHGNQGGNPHGGGKKGKD